MAAMTGFDAPVHTPLPDRALVTLTGPDWRSFLQGLITQDVETLPVGETRYAALLTPQGRLLHDMFVRADTDGATLDVLAATRDALVARLKMYRLRAKVDIGAADGRIAAAFGQGLDLGSGWVRDPRLAALGWRGVDQPTPAGAVEDEGSRYDLHRLQLGVADVARDDLSDRAYALEANLDLLNAVDFRKGCFVGQETTSRMKRRSVVKSRFVPIRFEGAPPAPGAEVLAGERRAGVVASGAPGVALALVRLDRALDASLNVEGRTVMLAMPDWLEATARTAVIAAD